MIRLLLTCSLISLIVSISSAQYVFKTKKIKEAKLICYVTYDKKEATKFVYVTKYNGTDALKTEGIWFYVTEPSVATLKVYFIKKKKRANTILYFCKTKEEFLNLSVGTNVLGN